VAARIEALGFGGQTLISSDVFEGLSDYVKEQCLITTVGGFELKGVSGEVQIYQCMPKELKGRTFRGVIRRRDSEGDSVIPDDDSMFNFLDTVNEEDLQVDVMTLTPIQLQSLVVRLRKKLSLVHELMLDDEVKESVTRRMSAISTVSEKGQEKRLSQITTGDDDSMGFFEMDISQFEEKKGQ